MDPFYSKDKHIKIDYLLIYQYIMNQMNMYNVY